MKSGVGEYLADCEEEERTMTSAQPHVNTDKQAAPARKMIFSHSLTHLACHFAVVDMGIQMVNSTRDERYKSRPLFARC